MANPESLISLDTGNNLAFQNDPTLAGAVIPRIAVVSSVSGPSGSSATQSQLVDSAGNPLSTGITPGSASTYNPLITGTYPEIVASWPNTTFTASASVAFDPRRYASLVLVSVVTAASGAGSVAPWFEWLEPNSGSWWRITTGSTLSSVVTANTDGSFTPVISNLLSAPISANRLPFTQARLYWNFSGAYIVVTSYLIGC